MGAGKDKSKYCGLKRDLFVVFVNGFLTSGPEFNGAELALDGQTEYSDLGDYQIQVLQKEFDEFLKKEEWKSANLINLGPVFPRLHLAR